MLLCVATVVYAKELKILVPVAPGAVMDHSARSVQQYLSKELDRNVVISYYPGGKGKLARQQLLQNTRTGDDSIMIDNVSFWVNNEDANYIPISYYGTSPTVIVARKNWKEPPELKNCQLKSPLTYGTAGIMSPPHILMELQSKKCKSMFVHVPYKGGSPALTDLLGGHIDLVVLSWTAAKPFVESGDIQVLYSIGSIKSPDQKWRAWQPAQYQKAPDPMSLFFIIHSSADPELRNEISSALELIYKMPEFLNEEKKYGYVRNKLNMSAKEQFDKYLKEIEKAITTD